MRRPRRSVAVFCIGVIALAPFLPGISFDYALFELQWVLLPDDTPLAAVIPSGPGSEQPVPLFALLPSRAPPTASPA